MFWAARRQLQQESYELDAKFPAFATASLA